MHLRSFFLLGFLLFAHMVFRGQGRSDTLVVGLYQAPPFVMEAPDGYTGLSVTLWENLARKIDRPYRYRFFSDEVALMRALTYGEVDIGVNPVVANPYRISHFEMTQPFFSSGVGVAATLESQSQFAIFIRNFFSLAFLEIVLLLLGILLVFGTLLWFVERRENPYQFRKGLRGLFDGLWWAAVTMTTVGYGDKAPKSHLGKAVAIVWMFTAIIIISSFTATIASTLTVNTLEADIQGLDDLFALERLGVVGATEAGEMLAEYQVAPSHTYASVRQGLRALLRKDVDVLLHERTSLNHAIGQLDLSGKVKLLPLTFRRQYRSLVMPGGHPEFKRINTALMEYLQSESWSLALKQYGLKR